MKCCLKWLGGGTIGHLAQIEHGGVVLVMDNSVVMASSWFDLLDWGFSTLLFFRFDSSECLWYDKYFLTKTFLSDTVVISHKNVLLHILYSMCILTVLISGYQEYLRTTYCKITKAIKVNWCLKDLIILVTVALMEIKVFA